MTRIGKDSWVGLQVVLVYCTEGFALDELQSGGKQEMTYSCCCIEPMLEDAVPLVTSS